MGNAMSCLSGKRQFTGKGPRKLYTFPIYLHLRGFKVSNFFFFFFLHYWLLREQLFPSLLPSRITILTLTDRQLIGKLTVCMRRSNSAIKLMYCIKGKMWQSSGKWRGSRFKHSLRSAWICVRVACWSGHLYQNVVSFIIHIFIYLLHGLFMYLFLPSLNTTVLFWLWIPIWQPFTPWK